MTDEKLFQNGIRLRTVSRPSKKDGLEMVLRRILKIRLGVKFVWLGSSLLSLKNYNEHFKSWGRERERKKEEREREKEKKRKKRKKTEKEK